jgi:hypothetical protein
VADSVVVAAQSEAVAAHRAAGASRGNRAAGTEQWAQSSEHRAAVQILAAEGWGVLAAEGGRRERCWRQTQVRDKGS